VAAGRTLGIAGVVAQVAVATMAAAVSCTGAASQVRPDSSAAARGKVRPDSVIPLAPVVVRVLKSSLVAGTPYAISVASGADLRRGNPGAYLEEMLRAVPGVQVQNRYNLASGERLAVRGFGSRAQFGIRGLHILVDGIPATLPDGQSSIDHLDLATLGRVEILRGPGASLYGNAAGGVLEFESQAPATSPAQVTTASSGGSWDLRTWLAEMTGTIDSTGYRASFSRYAFDGFRRNPVADDGSAYGGATRSIFNGNVFMPLASGRMRLVLNYLDLAARNAGSLDQTQLALGDRRAYSYNVVQKVREDVQQGQAGLSWMGRLGALTTDVAVWGLHRKYLGPIPSTVVGFHRNAGGARAIVHRSVQTSRGALTLEAGLETALQSDDRRNWANDLGDKGALSLDQQETVRSAGLFGQVRFDVTRRVAAQGALRYDHFVFRVRDRFLADGSDDSGRRAMTSLSPSLGLVMDAGRGFELFGSVASSFETPTTTELANRPDGAGGFNPDLEPMRGITVEGGVRGRVGAEWRFEATLFHMGLSGELVAYEVPAQPGRTFYRNSGRSLHQGWEISVDGRPLPHTSLQLAYTRVDGRFRSYATDQADYSGNRIPGLAPYRLDGRLAVDLGQGYVQLRGLYQDAIPVDDANQYRSPGYFLADVRVGLQDLQAARLRLSPYAAVANVLDRRYDTSVVVNAFGRRYFEPGPGRSYEVGLSVTIGG
jgi:iron complex outermembrane receptor protein